MISGLFLIWQHFLKYQLQNTWTIEILSVKWAKIFHIFSRKNTFLKIKNGKYSKPSVIMLFFFQIISMLFISNSNKRESKVPFGDKTIFFFQKIESAKQVPSLLLSLFLRVSNLFPTHRTIIQYSCQNQNLSKSSICNSSVYLNSYTRAVLKWGISKIDGNGNRGKLIHVGHQRIASFLSLKLSIACRWAPAIWCAHLICSPIVNNPQEHGCTGLLEKRI